MASPSILRLKSLNAVKNQSSPLARKIQVNGNENATRASAAILSPRFAYQQPVKKQTFLPTSSIEKIAPVAPEWASEDQYPAVAKKLFIFKSDGLKRKLPESESKKCDSQRKVPTISISEEAHTSQANLPSPLPSAFMDVNSPARLDGTNYVSYPSSLVIGKGSFGTVCTGCYRGTKVAVKIMDNCKLQPSTITSEKHALLLSHEHVIRVLLVEELAEHAIIIMEHWGTVNLQSILDLAPLQFIQAANYARQVALALEYIHGNAILHLDVKPNNILVRNHICKISDFGCSKKLSEPIEILLQALGTVCYCAPEILCGRVPTTKADVYSYGILLWRLVSDRNPFGGENQYVIIYKVVSQKARPKALLNVHPHYAALYEQCWDPDPSIRPEMSHIVENLLSIYKNIPKDL